MLTQLDTLIGFVVVMSIVSLMVMIATQLCSNFLGLRGKNLHDAIETLFHQLSPQMDGEARSRLIDAALINPIASDTILSTAKAEGFLQRYVPWLGRLRKVWSRASAIRPDELIELVKGKAPAPVVNMLDLLTDMHALMTNPALQAARASFQPAIDALEQVLPTPRTPAGSGKSVKNHLARLRGEVAPAAAGNPPRGRKAVQDITEEVAKALFEYKRVLRELPEGTLPANLLQPLRDLEAHLEQVVAEFDAAMATFKSAAQRRAVFVVAKAARDLLSVVQQGAEITQHEKEHFEKWFNAAQDRAQQWFSMHTRVATVILSILAAFVLQLDTFEVVRLLATNPDIRAKLVAQADSLEREKQSIDQQSFTPDMHQAALKTVADAHPEWKTLPGAALPIGLDVTGAKKWFAEQLKAKPSPNNAAIFAAYAQALTAQQFNRNLASLQKLSDETKQSALQLMPTPYPITLNSKWSLREWYSPVVRRVGENGVPLDWSWPLHHLLGIIISAALLSLGSPFWFSLLKNLTALRPALAQAIDTNPAKPTSNQLAASRQPRQGAPAA